MNNFEAAIVKYICPICGSVVEDNIIMNSRLTEEDASKVRELHNKIVGYSDHACEECSKYKDTAVYFIEIDSESLLVMIRIELDELLELEKNPN